MKPENITSEQEIERKTSDLEKRVFLLENVAKDMKSGVLSESVLELCPELSELKQVNDRLKYRCGILKQSVAEECANAPKISKKDAGPSAKAEKGEIETAPDWLEGLDPMNSGSFVAQLKDVFTKAVHIAHPGVHVEIVLKEATNKKFGDYQFNSSMQLSKELNERGTKTNPKAVAQSILSALPKVNIIEKAEVAGAGFINIFLNVDELSTGVSKLLVEGVKPPILTPKKVVVDFSAPNIAKEMHVGHLRSTIIGDSICRLLEFIGFDVSRINHIGDWGTQFGMLIAHLQERFPQYKTTCPPIGDLMRFYKESKKRFDSDEGFKKRAYECVVNLQKHEPDHIKAWKLICDVSRKDFESIYARLDIKITERGESFYQERMTRVVDYLKEKGELFKDEGRDIAWVSIDDQVPLTIVKSDGGYTYDTSDMAAIRHRLQEERADWLIYVVDTGQSLHLQTIFAMARKLGWYDSRKQRVEHVNFGVVLGEDKKKFKTRSGDTVRLTDLLDEGLARAAATLEEKERQKELTPVELDEARNAVAYGCIKYSDLAQNRTSDYVFSFDKVNT